jgi:hypothetical protein
MRSEVFSQLLIEEKNSSMKEDSSALEEKIPDNKITGSNEDMISAENSG